MENYLSYPQPIRGYLQRLDLESQALPERQRRILRSQVEGHIDEALSAEGDSPRQVVATLGKPSELVSEAFAQQESDEELPGGGTDRRGAAKATRPMTVLMWVVLVLGCLWSALFLISLIAVVVVLNFGPPWIAITSLVGLAVSAPATALAWLWVRKNSPGSHR